MTGLTTQDIEYLDEFEGDVRAQRRISAAIHLLNNDHRQEYTRQSVGIHLLGSLVNLSIYDSGGDELLLPSKPAALPAELAPTIEAETYIYNDPTMLKGELWSFEEFVKKNAWKWYVNDDEEGHEELADP